MRRITKRRSMRKGFTLVECLVAIAIFTIMATMFAAFLMDSVRVVNVTLANDKDREALLEAISAANSSECHTTNGVVNVSAVGTDGKILNLEVNLGDKAQNVTLEDKFVRYTAPNGTRYTIYLGANAMAVKYIVIYNLKDNKTLTDAIKDKTNIKELQVVNKGEIKPYFFEVKADDPASVFEIVEDESTGEFNYIKYTDPIGEKYLIYRCKQDPPEPAPTP